MSGRNIYVPFSLLTNQNGDLVQGVLYVWNFFNEFKEDIGIENTSFKTIVTTLFHEHFEKEDWETIQLFKFLIPPLLHHYHLLPLVKINMPIDSTTITMLVAIIMEKDGSEFCMNVMRYIRSGRFITMIEPRTKVSILVKLIQMFFQTKEGQAKTITKKKTKIIGVDSMYRYFIQMNDFLIIETYELMWMLVDNKLKMDNLICFYAKSGYQREQELSEHLRKIQGEIKYEDDVYQEFGITNEMINANCCRSDDYRRFAPPLSSPMAEENKVREITIELIKDVMTFLTTLHADMEKRKKHKMKGLSFCVNVITALKNIYNENLTNFHPIINNMYHTLMKTITRLPVPYQDEVYYKKLIKIVNMECMGNCNISTIKILFYFVQKMVDLKHVKLRLDQSSYDEISFSDEGEMEEDQSNDEDENESSENMDNVVSEDEKQDEMSEDEDESEEEVKIVKPVVKRRRIQQEEEEEENENEMSESESESEENDNEEEEEEEEENGEMEIIDEESDDDDD